MSDDNRETKGFWGFLKSKTNLNKGDYRDDRNNHRSRGRDDFYDPDPYRESSRSVDVKGKGPERPVAPSSPIAGRRRRGRGPLHDWPPSGVLSHEDLTLGHALDLISRGAPVWNGHKRSIQHFPEEYCHLYATTTPGSNRNSKKKGKDSRQDAKDTDAANLHNSMVQLMTLCLMPPGPAAKPWDTVDQRPSYAFHYGVRPGTVTLNSWVSRSSVLPPPMALRDSGATPRDADLETILKRLQELELYGLEEDDEKLMYRNLYRKFLRDPEKDTRPHRTLDLQITDLIMVLSRPANGPGGWIDYSEPRNQIATRFLFDTSEGNHENYVRFFHQLLLSCELDLRINARKHMDEARHKLLVQLPPSIKWSIALSRRWLDNMRIEKYGETAKQGMIDRRFLHEIMLQFANLEPCTMSFLPMFEYVVKIRFRLKNRQIKMLKRFAQMLKWPNLADTVEEIYQADDDDALGTISSHAMAFFSGLVLPGPTFPFLMMNSLVDLDPDKATDDLALLTHIHPACGFQYRGGQTYWSSASVVGKVLAPTCMEVGGWVGPALGTTDLPRTQIARIRTRLPKPTPNGSNASVARTASPTDKRLMTPEKVLSMKERSDPLGPPSDVYPVRDYDLPLPKGDSLGTGEIIDFVRLVKLTLKRLGGPPPDNKPVGVAQYDAGVQFAIDGVSWPLRLSFDVDFIYAHPCEPNGGPHPLFFEYAYVSVPVDRIVDIHDWGGLYGGGRDSSASSLSTAGGGPRPPRRPPPVKRDPGETDKVLVVEAFGVPDNEVLARAWCAHWGLTAVVADVRKTCMACAIRTAYAATVTVVILVENVKGDF
ncbi:uncharacterized protein PgNI_07598 [Pyricularia grisea]|uniref:VTC domain-containing protein n=1 Tax=Pyricularia grisea TaxID=148305 RepID=A0A6P8B352_PYRGI|nr:uncharacterized protein PgNI_07598 [Pyricularia grisea]TLD09234.1 hypothetical protein PgNI_07598 [Pyricularia grisea]